jgi:hypothetical protein
MGGAVCSGSDKRVALGRNDGRGRRMRQVLRGLRSDDGRSRKRWSHSPPIHGASGHRGEGGPSRALEGPIDLGKSPLVVASERTRGLRATRRTRRCEDAEDGGNVEHRGHRTPHGSAQAQGSPGVTQASSEGAIASAVVRTGARETQESHERQARRQRRVCRSDFPAEQGLEVAPPSQDGGERRGGNGARRRANGCLEGECSGGHVHRRGRTDRRGRHAASRCRNPVNPMVGCEMQQAREPAGGASRRGGENPRGRNERDGWHRRAEWRGFGRDMEWTPASDVDGGADMWTWKALGYEPGGKRCASDCGHAQH